MSLAIIKLVEALPNKPKLPSRIRAANCPSSVSSSGPAIKNGAHRAPFFYATVQRNCLLAAKATQQCGNNPFRLVRINDLPGLAVNRHFAMRAVFFVRFAEVETVGCHHV
jgi:hypothetical protein